MFTRIFHSSTDSGNRRIISRARRNSKCPRSRSPITAARTDSSIFTKKRKHSGSNRFSAANFMSRVSGDFKNARASTRTESSRPARAQSRRLPKFARAGDEGESRRLLLQTADRSRVARKIRRRADRIVGVSAGRDSAKLLSENYTEAADAARRFQKYFGAENFYLELQHHPSIPEQKIANERVIELAKKMDIPLVATNDCHYVRPEDAEAQDVLLCVQTGNLVAEPNRMTMRGEDYSLRSPDEMKKAFAENSRRDRKHFENSGKMRCRDSARQKIDPDLFDAIRCAAGRLFHRIVLGRAE